MKDNHSRVKRWLQGFLLISLGITSLIGAACHAQAITVVSTQADREDLIQLKERPLPAQPKLGLVLGGGGARGAAEVGVLEVLEHAGLHFDYIAGTSIGSVVGGLYDAGVSAVQLQEEFESGRAMRHFMPLPLPVGIALEPFMLGARLLGAKPYDGLYPGAILHRYLKKLVPAGSQTIEQLKTPFAAVSLNLLDGKPYMIRGGPLARAMQASSAVPGLRKPVQITDHLFVDGGVVCNLPVKQCREMGADIIIAVNIDEPFEERQCEHYRKAGSVSKRMINWSLYTIDKPQAALADVVIHPDTEHIGLLATNRGKIRQAVEAGRQAAEAALPAIRAKLQGVESVR